MSKTYWDRQTSEPNVAKSGNSLFLRNIRVDHRNDHLITKIEGGIQRQINNVLDRYQFMVGSQRAEVLGMFTHAQQIALCDALRGPILEHKIFMADIRPALRLALVSAHPQILVAVEKMTTVQLVALVDAIEDQLNCD